MGAVIASEAKQSVGVPTAALNEEPAANHEQIAASLPPVAPRHDIFKRSCHGERSNPFAPHCCHGERGSTTIEAIFPHTSNLNEMKKLQLILRTIRHLRPIQIRYQLWYRLRKKYRKMVGFNYSLSIDREAEPLRFTPWIDKPVSLKIFSEENETKYSFTFLNITKNVSPPIEGIPRRGEGVGKLWTYNLNYMDYLLQSGMDKEAGIQLMHDSIQNLSANSTGLEPYPIALRGINWIKFLSKMSLRAERSEAKQSRHSNASDPSTPRHCEERPQGVTKQSHDVNSIASSLYAQYHILLDNLEYHLLANHLLEDGLSLLFGAFFFKDERFYKKAKYIIETELEEQILNDGAHFELSPMYHQIILDRLLDCINLVQNNQRFEKQNILLDLMKEKAGKMLAWLNMITFSTGEIPLLNDSVSGIAPTTEQLNEYARRLKIRVIRENPCNPYLSGYRKFTASNYECMIDTGPVGSSYQPGHAHADTFNFVLNINDKPVIVDTGISTYEANKIRLKERGTAAHNTVTVQDNNSSEVWSSFRVANRAEVKIVKEENNLVTAQHNGFRKLKTIHQREWHFKEEQVVICDTLIGKYQEGTAHFHLAPGLIPEETENIIRLKNSLISFSDDCTIKLVKSQIPNGYNQFSEHYKIEVSFNKQLETRIIINHLQTSSQ